MATGEILIVDDNLTNLKLARVLLIAEGFEVATAGNAAEALDHLNEHHPALILMDLQMPGMNGLELTRRLKSAPETRDIIVLAMTAYAMKGDEVKALTAGCDGYIPKPIDTKTLADTLKQYLNGTKPRGTVEPNTRARE